MGFSLDNVVPWGRSYEEYLGMLGLGERDLELRILGCGDGPAAFNSALTQRGGRIVSVDPIYAASADRIRERIAQTYGVVMAQLLENRDDYLWDSIPSVAELGRLRLSAMESFLGDFEGGKAEGRYVPGALPSLPFENGAFDLALSSHFLFLYSAQLSAELHLRSIREMLRVAREVRLFPLLTLDGALSPHLGFVTDALGSGGFAVERKQVPYEFQKGGNEMLVVKPA